MPTKTSSTTGSELFIVDNSDEDWKVLRYLHDWCQLARGIDIATGYFEIGAFLALKDEWQKVDQIRILMGEECSLRTRDAFQRGLNKIARVLDASLEKAKETNDFLNGVPAIVESFIGQPAYHEDSGHTGVILDVHLDVRPQTAKFQHDGTDASIANWVNLEKL